MIYYSPVDGDVRASPVVWQCRTVFVMQQLGEPIPREVKSARKTLNRVLKRNGFTPIDASGVVQGKDFLSKIWEVLLGCPVGIAIVHEAIAPKTLANIYYELGMLQSLGRETLVIRVGQPDLPSDLVRTEYVVAGRDLGQQLESFLESIKRRAAYYLDMADLVENNPLLAIDYLRRAHLLSSDSTLPDQAREIWETAQGTPRAKASVELLALDFGRPPKAKSR